MVIKAQLAPPQLWLPVLLSDLSPGDTAQHEAPVRAGTNGGWLVVGSQPPKHWANCYLFFITTHFRHFGITT